jgi:hypothetical protein
MGGGVRATLAATVAVLAVDRLTLTTGALDACPR